MRSTGNENGDPRKDDKIPAGTPRLAVLGLISIAAIALCAMMTLPFLPALAWALALAIIAHPLHRWLITRVKSPDLAAGITVAIVVVVLGVPAFLVFARLAKEATQVRQAIDEEATQGAIRSVLSRIPPLEEAFAWMRSQIDQEEIRRFILSRAGDVSSILQGSVAGLFQVLLMVFALFYFIRDGGKLMAGTRELAPLSPIETQRLSCRVEDAIHATIYGTFVTGLLQGVTGGLLFWLIGLPGPVLWGTILFLLDVIPLVGGVLVWLPASLYLLLDGRVGPAVLLIVWGILMAGPVGNYAYARCAGQRMRMHPLPTLFAYLGGLAVFGVTGMVLGPVIVALTAGLIDLWRWRMVPASTPVQPEATSPSVRV